MDKTREPAALVRWVEGWEVDRTFQETETLGDIQRRIARETAQELCGCMTVALSESPGRHGPPLAHILVTDGEKSWADVVYHFATTSLEDLVSKFLEFNAEMMLTVPGEEGAFVREVSRVRAAVEAGIKKAVFAAANDASIPVEDLPEKFRQPLTAAGVDL